MADNGLRGQAMVPEARRSPRGVTSTRGHGEKRMTATLAPSVAQHVPTFTIAHLRQALAELTAEMPNRADRLQRAVATVVACDMERFTYRPGWHIQSVREPETF